MNKPISVTQYMVSGQFLYARADGSVATYDYLGPVTGVYPLTDGYMIFYQALPDKIDCAIVDYKEIHIQPPIETEIII